VDQAKKFFRRISSVATTSKLASTDGSGRCRRDGAAVDPERSWTLLAHALMASNEFTFLD
jgi:hypothetical protein